MQFPRRPCLRLIFRRLCINFILRIYSELELRMADK